MRIAIIGCGEVGRTYAEAVAAQGRHELVLNDSRPSPPALEMAARLGVELHTTAGPWLTEVDRVWVCVTGDVAKNVCAAVIDHLDSGAVVVDLTTATPADKREMAAMMSDRDHAYVDAVIMGAIGLTGVKTALLGAGPHSAEALADLAELGAPVRSLPEARPGDAAALKLLRTVLTKGLEALGVECLIAAEQQGVRKELYEVLGDIDAAGLTNFLNAVVRTHVIHAERRMHEIQRADAQLEQFGLPSLLMEASEQRFALTAKALTQTPPAPGTADDIDSAVEWLLETTAANASVAQ
jgi:3-hydroxyisobutyrate dehydrogenase-like beta-hydroxyacid dehydrogenase